MSPIASRNVSSTCIVDRAPFAAAVAAYRATPGPVRPACRRVRRRAAAKNRSLPGQASPSGLKCRFVTQAIREGTRGTRDRADGAEHRCGCERSRRIERGSDRRRRRVARASSSSTTIRSSRACSRSSCGPPATTCAWPPTASLALERRPGALPRPRARRRDDAEHGRVRAHPPPASGPPHRLGLDHHADGARPLGRQARRASRSAPTTTSSSRSTRPSCSRGSAACCAARATCARSRRSPGLPGNVRIEEEIEARVDRRIPFAILYADLDHFKAYNDHYGFMRGDQVIQSSARLFEEVSQRRDRRGRVRRPRRRRRLRGRGRPRQGRGRGPGDRGAVRPGGARPLRPGRP